MRLFASILAAVAFLLPPSADVQTQLVVRVEMSEFTFRPATIHLTTGRPVRLVLVNRGQIAHQFETAYLRELAMRIVGSAIYMEATGLELIRLDPGGTARLEFLPRKKGHFVFFCAIEGHREAGMQGALEVR